MALDILQGRTLCKLFWILSSAYPNTRQKINNIGFESVALELQVQFTSLKQPTLNLGKLYNFVQSETK